MHRIYIVNILCKNKKVLFNLNCFTFIIDFGLDFVYLNVIVKCYKFVLFVEEKEIMLKMLVNWKSSMKSILK